MRAKISDRGVVRPSQCPTLAIPRCWSRANSFNHIQANGTAIKQKGTTSHWPVKIVVQTAAANDAREVKQTGHKSRWASSGFLRVTHSSHSCRSHVSIVSLSGYQLGSCGRIFQARSHLLRYIGRSLWNQIVVTAAVKAMCRNRAVVINF